MPEENKSLVEDLVEDVKKEFKDASEAQVKEAELEQWKSDPKGFLDIITGKVISRKLMVWIVSTVAMFLGTLDPDNWTTICLMYIGSLSLVSIASSFATAKNGGSYSVPSWKTRPSKEKGSGYLVDKRG